MISIKHLRGNGVCPWVKVYYVHSTQEVLWCSNAIYTAVFTSTQKQVASISEKNVCFIPSVNCWTITTNRLIYRKYYTGTSRYHKSKIFNVYIILYIPVSSLPSFKVQNHRCRRYTAWLDKTSAALARRFYSIYPDAQCSPPWVVAVLSQANLYLFF